MRRQKTTLFAVCMLVFSWFLMAQQKTVPIEGTYTQEGTPVALQIEKLPGSGYIFRMVLTKSNGNVVLIESQSAYVADSSGTTFVFYWHTGRYEDIPGTDSIIVYKLTYDGIRKLSGTYFFPEKPETPPISVTFVRR